MTIVYIARMPNRVIGGVFETEKGAKKFITQKAKKRRTDIANYKILVRMVRKDD